MPIPYEIDVARQRIHTRCVGDVTLPDVVAHFRALVADPRLPNRLDVLLDFRELATYPDGRQIQSIAIEIRQLLAKVAWRRCAVIGASDLAFGIGRMFEMITEPSFVKTMVFRDLEAANRWLDTREEDA
jgi:hypothetical protein